MPLEWKKKTRSLYRGNFKDGKSLAKHAQRANRTKKETTLKEIREDVLSKQMGTDSKNIRQEARKNTK